MLTSNPWAALRISLAEQRRAKAMVGVLALTSKSARAKWRNFDSTLAGAKNAAEAVDLEIDRLIERLLD